jgi:hypothetical protein
MESRKTFALDEAKEVARQLGVDFSFETFDLEEFRLALSIELEHGSCHPDTDVTHDDPILTGKLALAHLHTRADFYDHLLDVEGPLSNN